MGNCSLKFEQTVGKFGQSKNKNQVEKAKKLG